MRTQWEREDWRWLTGLRPAAGVGCWQAFIGPAVAVRPDTSPSARRTRATPLVAPLVPLVARSSSPWRHGPCALVRTALCGAAARLLAHRLAAELGGTVSRLSEVAARVRRYWCKGCDEEVEQPDEQFGSDGLCEECRGKCFKCEQPIKEGRVCASCKKEYGVKMRTEEKQNEVVLDPRKTGFHGGQVQRDVSKDTLTSLREEERQERWIKARREGDGKLPTTGGEMRFCKGCGLTVPLALVKSIDAKWCPECLEETA